MARQRTSTIRARVKKILLEAGVTEPPILVETIAKKHGLQIRFQPLESSLSGFVFQDEQGPVIGVNTSHPKVRQRFTIAHELGHFLLKHDNKLYVDRAFIMKRSPLSSQGIDTKEVEANIFAAEILMPHDFIARDVEGIEDFTDEETIITLAHRYHVSTQALVLRLINLGYIDQQSL